MSAASSTAKAETLDVNPDPDPPVAYPSDATEQWVARIKEYSSQYDAVRWAANNLIGEPRVYTLEHNYGDIRGSYTQPYGTTGVHFVEFYVDNMTTPLGIHVYETYHPGAVVGLKGFSYDANEWVVLWAGAGSAAPPVSRIWKPQLDASVAGGLVTDLFRIEIDTDSIEGYTEIDCIKVVGAVPEEAALESARSARDRMANLNAFEETMEAVEKDKARKAIKSKRGKFAALSLAVDVDAANSWFHGGGPGSANGSHPFEMQIRAGILTPKAVLAQSIKHVETEATEPLALLVQAVAQDALVDVRTILDANPMLLSGRPPLHAMDMVHQWVARVDAFSAQYDTSSWKAANLVGEPRVYPQYGDIAGAWAQPYNSQNVEWVEVAIEQEIWVTCIDVYETYNPGALTAIQAWDGDAWVDIWVNESPTAAPAASRIFSPPLSLPPFKTTRFKLLVNCAAVPGYNELDAIQFHGGIGALGDPASSSSGSGAGPSSSAAGGSRSLAGFDIWQRSPLLVAAKNGNVVMTALLASHGADVARKSMYGHSPLSKCIYNAGRTDSTRASLRGYWDTMLTLLSLPAVHRPYQREQGYATNDLGETILHHAVRGDLESFVQVLLAFPTFDATIQSKSGHTPLAMAGTAGVRHAFEAAVAQRAAASSFDGGIFDAARAGDMYAVQHLLDGDASLLNSADDAGVTPLMAAVIAGHEPVVALLLSRGADPTTMDTSGNTVLMKAATSGSTAMVTMLVAQSKVLSTLTGSEAEQMTNANGDTVLHCVARGGSVDAAHLLMVLGSLAKCLEVQNNQGLVPSQVAVSADVAAALRDAHVYSSKVSGLATPRAFTPMAGRVCAVCFMPPPAEEESMVYTCTCNAQFCEECFQHMANAALHDGEFPTCCNALCEAPVPMSVLRKSLPVNQLLLVAAVTVNKEFSIDAIYRSNCVVCNRVNDIYPVLQSESTRFQCDHCGVYACVVCQNIHPRKDVAPLVAAGQDDAAAAARRRNAMDDEIHAGCADKFTSLQKFSEFNTLLNEVGQRKCPRCSTVGIKDDACCHLHCPGPNGSGCSDYCYICGRNPEHGLDGMSVGSHAPYDITEFLNNTDRCMMYGYFLSHRDPRIAALGCGDGECRPNGSCTDDGTCRVARDRAAHAQLATIRVRCAILDFMYKMGKSEFVAMITRFGWRDLVNNNYFYGQFPWDTPDTPSWLEFEPENVREFYGERLHWFVWYEDVEAFKARAEGRTLDGADGDGADGAEAGPAHPTPPVANPPVPPPMPDAPVVDDPFNPDGLPDRFVFNRDPLIDVVDDDDDDDVGRRRRPCLVM